MISVIVIILSLVTCCMSYADVIDDTVHAFIADQIRRPMLQVGAPSEAVSKTAQGVAATTYARQGVGYVKQTKKIMEKKVYKTFEKTTGITKEQAATALAIGMTASKGVVDTRVVKYKMRPAQNLEIRPDVVYNFNNRGISSTVSLKWSW